MTISKRHRDCANADCDNCHTRFCAPVSTDALMARKFERSLYAKLDRVATDKLDPGALLASGAMEGPFTTPHPVTLTLRQRLARWWRAHVVGGQEWGERFR